MVSDRGLLIGLDVAQPIHDPAPDLEVRWPGPDVAPALKCARTDAPSPREVRLVQMGDSHRRLPGSAA